MADSNNGGGAVPWLAFLVGVLVMAAIGFFVFTQMTPQRTEGDLDIIAPTIQAPSPAPLAVPAPDVNVNVPAPAIAPPAPEAKAPTPEPEPTPAPY